MAFRGIQGCHHSQSFVGFKYIPDKIDLPPIDAVIQSGCFHGTSLLSRSGAIHTTDEGSKQPSFKTYPEANIRFRGMAGWVSSKSKSRSKSIVIPIPISIICFQNSPQPQQYKIPQRISGFLQNHQLYLVMQ
jgi:hypothetical protein